VRRAGIEFGSGMRNRCVWRQCELIRDRAQVYPRRGQVKTVHVVVAMAAWLGVSGMVRASSAEIGCRRAEALVALAVGT
jgi:hypothetical protein